MCHELSLDALSSGPAEEDYYYSIIVAADEGLSIFPVVYQQKHKLTQS